MKLSWCAYRLNFRHPFRLATGERTGTDSVFVRLEKNGMYGYGEATLPPYLKENTSSVISFLKTIQAECLSAATPQEFLSQLHQLEGENHFAVCALEEAFLQLQRKFNKEDANDIRRVNTLSTYTLGLGTEEEIIEKLKIAEGFPVLKVKLQSETDQQPINLIRKYTDRPLCIDANQGWKDIEHSIRFSYWLRDMNVMMIEQPFAADHYEMHEAFRKKSALKVIADESITTLESLKKNYACFDGVNVKLLKCGGPLAASEMLRFAKEKSMFTLIGCMSESSCGVYHAAELGAEADLLDVDGPLLINNDPFNGFELNGGIIRLSKLEPGLELNFVNE